MSDEDLRNRYRRDFTNEPIRAAAPKHVRPATTQPVPASPALSATESQTPPPIVLSAEPTLSRRPKRKRRSAKKTLFVLFILCLVGAGGFAAYHFIKLKKEPAIPTGVAANIHITMLYPSQLPPGYKVVKSSFNTTQNNIVAYYAEDAAGNKLNFTIQPRPANFDFEQFYSQIISNSTRFNTPIGEAAIGTANGRLLGSLATTKSWALVTGNNASVTSDKIQTAISGLKVINLSN